jgi:hypothetical protein
MRGVDSPDGSSPPAAKTAVGSIARWWSNRRVVGKVAVVLILIAVLAVVLAATLADRGTNKQEAALAAFCADEQLLQTSFRIQAMSQLASRLPRDVQLFHESGDARDAAAVEQLLAAVKNMVTTLEAHADIGPANAKMARAVDGLPACTSV